MGKGHEIIIHTHKEISNGYKYLKNLIIKDMRQKLSFITC